LPPQSDERTMSTPPTHHCVVPPSHVVDLPREDDPRALAPYWFDAPATWFGTTSRYSERRHAPVTGCATFLRLWSHYRVLLMAAVPDDTSLSRGFLPPQRYLSMKVYQPQALPARVTWRPRTYHVPRRFAPSTDSLVSFQPDALSGHRLQSLTERRSSQLLSQTSPPAIGEP
jgi:hypothetical protein